MPILHDMKSFLQRFNQYTRTIDEFLCISEKVESADWDTTSNGNLVALVSHFLYILAQINLKNSPQSRNDLSTYDHLESKWPSNVASLTIFTLWIFSILNAYYTLCRTRHYRLLESSIFNQPSTKSARRVRVDSSPVSSLHLRISSNLLGDSSAESRSYPDPTRDVWEIAIWDPILVCLRIFCYFSPGHTLIYWLFFPISALDIRPSVTIVKVVFLQILMSVQLSLLEANFCQKSKDSSIIHGNLMNEYNTKFVHPRLNPIVRHAGTQCVNRNSNTTGEIYEDVDTYQPAIIFKKNFETNPNPQLAKFFNSENDSVQMYRDNSSIASMTPYDYDTSRRTSTCSFTTHSVSRDDENPQNMMDETSNFNSPFKEILISHEMHCRYQDTSHYFNAAVHKERDNKDQEFIRNEFLENKIRQIHFPQPTSRPKAKNFARSHIERVPSMF